MQFEGKNCVITGGSGGIGLAIARCLLTNGAEVNTKIKNTRKDWTLYRLTNTINPLNRIKVFVFFILLFCEHLENRFVRP